MKRWGFKGQTASHGVSKTHRHGGSTGHCQEPDRVFKNMGGNKVTVLNNQLHAVDTDSNVLLVKGAVPAPKRGLLCVKDAHRKKWQLDAPPPFPAWDVDADAPDGQEVLSRSSIPYLVRPLGELRRQTNF